MGRLTSDMKGVGTVSFQKFLFTLLCSRCRLSSGMIDKNWLMLAHGCCEQTRLGDSTYIFSHIDGDTYNFYCASKCVYKKEGEPNSRYCLSVGGDEQPVCE